ncbi:MAG: flagellar motor protein MotA [Alphaproteobacteria bacterium]|nr:flagellar motor protein MotA [Alphaproteobacteria bacterium]
MTRPFRYLLRMALFLAAVGGVVAFLHEQLIQAFHNAPILNSIIVVVLLLGVAENIRQVLILYPEVAWIRGFQAEAHIPGSTLRRIRLLSPMVAMLGERRSGRLQLSATATRAVLDGISSRLEESRDLSRYLVGLLIFLGLLGTFWGLLETVSAVSGVIAGLSGSTDASSLFNDLQAGLRAPLSGMGTAFGTSLFGLAGSLVVGFLDLQSGQAQNRFYNELEEWLSGVTRLGGGGPVGDGDQSVPAYIQALLEQTADNLENFQRTVQQAEQGRQGANAALVMLGERMTQLTEEMRAERDVVARLAEAQLELRPALQRFAEAASRGGAGAGDEALRASLRGIESLLARLLEENQAGRAQFTQDVRNEFRLLARTIAALADDQR